MFALLRHFELESKLIGNSEDLLRISVPLSVV
jgi:hypothetical protein